MSGRDAFVSRFSGVFENSPWIAEDAYDAGLPTAHTPDGVHSQLCAAMRAMSHADKLALIKAHPDLAGKLSRTGGLTAASSSEQVSAGLDKLSDADFETFTTLNAAYMAKFGIPFVMAVKGRSVVEILAAFRARLNNDVEIEFEAALSEIEQIALLRIQDIMRL